MYFMSHHTWKYQMSMCFTFLWYWVWLLGKGDDRLDSSIVEGALPPCRYEGSWFIREYLVSRNSYHACWWSLTPGFQNSYFSYFLGLVTSHFPSCIFTNALFDSFTYKHVENFFKKLSLGITTISSNHHLSCFCPKVIKEWSTCYLHYLVSKLFLVKLIISCQTTGPPGKSSSLLFNPW